MKILVATDGSTGALQALHWLANFPLPADATIEVVSASRLPFSAKAVAAMGWREFLAESQRAVDDACERLAKRWTAATGRVLDGDAREAIVEAAIQGKADLIVVGARGLGAAASFLLGSVSLGIARDAPCPVLAGHGIHEEQDYGERVARAFLFTRSDDRDIVGRSQEPRRR